MNKDGIEKSILLRASMKRVWRALADPVQFGSWFGMRVEGSFEAGRVLRVAIAPTTVDPEVAKLQKPYEGFPFEIRIVQVEPERIFSFRWTLSEQRLEDYSNEPTTLVEFVLQQEQDGVLLSVTETEFEQLPAEHRERLRARNEQGWGLQMKLIEGYLAALPDIDC